MRSTETPWEERTLGLKSYEIVLAEDDTIEEFLRHEGSLIEKGARYILARVPVNMADFFFELPKAKYVFIEALISLSLRKEDYVCPPYIARFDRNIETRKAERPEDKKRVYDEIAKGGFNTDRISLDKHFSQETAGLRYINWVKELVAEGNDVHEVFSNDKPMGFFQIKELDENTAQGILTGAYEYYMGSGALIMKKLCDLVWASGYKHYDARVASNNLKALRSNLIFGSQISSISYSYVKHIA